jgi:hypothetical protein
MLHLQPLRSMSDMEHAFRWRASSLHGLSTAPYSTGLCATLHSLAPFQVQGPPRALHATLQIVDINALPDPCPLPHTVKKRGLNDKERLLYAPMADVGGLLYDKDAVYIDIPDWKVGLLSALSQITRHP